MNNERIMLLKQLYALEQERDRAKEKYPRIARARQYKINQIEKKLKMIKEKEMEEESCSK